MKRKFLSLFLTLCLMAGLLPVVALPVSAAEAWSYPTSDPGEFTLGVDGTATDAGTAVNPYAISSEQDLANLAYQVNNGNDYSGAYFSLTTDIVLNDNVLAADGTLNSDGFTAWTPIGTTTNGFCGVFEGNDHTVSGIYINDSAVNDQGLFGYIIGGTIKNVGVTDSYISCGDHAGGIVGQSRYSTVENCSNSGRINGSNYVGGVVGMNFSSNVTNCHNDGRIDASHYAGGVVGEDFAVAGSTSLISNCYNTGTVHAVSYAGGIIGDLYKDSSNCYNTGTVTVSSYSAGGISGMCSSESTITACYNTGSVNANQYRAGGIAGFSAGVIQLSYNCGNISSIGSEMGGIVGRQSSGTVQNCYNTGCVTGSGSVGGVAGDGGSAAVTSCYYDKQICALDYGVGSDSATAGMGLAASDMVGTSMFSDSAWTTQDGLYPRLADPSGVTFDMDGTDEAVLYALPVFLDSGDTVKSVTKNFAVGTLTGASWSISPNDAISLSGTDASVTRQETDATASLTATYSGLTHTFELTVPAFEIWDGLTASTFSGGTGTEGNPYQISSADELAYLSYLVENGVTDTVNNAGARYSSLYYVLTGNIYLNADASNYENWDTSAPSNIWTPIGTSSSLRFTGSFNGNGHTISGIYISTASSNQGLFGYISGAAIQNVGVIDSYISGGASVGGVAGYVVSSTITDCFNAASISSSSANIGGILGYGEGVTGDEVTVERCYNSGTVVGTSDYSNYVGGIIGEMNKYGSLSSCYNTGSVSGNGEVGGIVGDFRLASIRYSYNIGSVSGGYYVGGIAGYCWDFANILEYSYNAGSVSCSNGTSGGIGGEFGYATVQYCYNTGSVSGNGDVGGVLGSDYENNTFLNCYYDKQMCTLEYGIGSDDTVTDMGILTSEMTGTAMFSDSNWTTGTGVYPRLAGMDATDTAYVSAAAVTLAGTSDDYETVDYISQDANASIADGVTWTSSSSSLSINHSTGDVSVEGSDTNVTLTISCGDAARTVAITEVEKLSSDADLTKVLSQTIIANSEAGTTDAPKTASMSVMNSVESVASGDIEVSANATVTFYGTDSTFTTEDTDGVTLTAGGNTMVYIKVTAQDEATFLYYKVTIARAAAASSGSARDTSSSNSSGNSAALYVNNEKITAGTAETTTENGQTQTTITVDTDKLEKLLASEGDGATVTVPMTNGSDVSSGVLTGRMVKDMEERAATLVVKTGSATYTLPAEQIDIDKVAGQFGEDINLSDIEVEVMIAEPSDDTVTVVENAADEGGFTLAVQPVAFTVTCTYHDRAAEVATYNAYVERTIKIPDGVDPKAITTAVVVESDGTVRQVPTQIAEIDGVYYAVINSLTNSVYALVCNPVEFDDVEGHWAQDAVNDMASRFIVTGYVDGTYKPYANITRAEFTTMVVRALGLSKSLGESSFTDVLESDWCCAYIKTAVSYGLITGYSDGRFGPNDTITREQAMTIISRAMKLTALSSDITDAERNDLLQSYSDAADISDYAKKSAAVCIETGIISGKGDETLAPKDNMTRAEVAVVIKRLLVQSGLI